MKRASSADLPFEIVPPDDTPEFLYPAYYSCLQWAIGFPPILQRFTSDTGKSLPRPRAPIEKIVDVACKFDPYEAFFRAFVPWFNTNVWGEMDGEEPDAVEG